MPLSRRLADAAVDAPPELLRRSVQVPDSEDDVSMNACLEQIQRDFEHHGTNVEVITHPLAITSQETAAAERISGHQVVKAVIAMVDDQPAVLGLQASREVDLDALRRELGAREARLAREEEFAPLFRTARWERCPRSAGRRRRALVRDKGRRYARRLGHLSSGGVWRTIDRGRGVVASIRRRRHHEPRSA